MQRIYFLVGFIICINTCLSQKISNKDRFAIQNPALEEWNNRGLLIGDSLRVFIRMGICKNRPLIIIEKYAPVIVEHASPVSTQKTHDIKVHGNILYNFSYRSYLDTPYAQKDLIQNLIQTNLSVMIKDKYPLVVTISSRNSNSPFFQNTTDVHIEYQKRQLLDNIKEDLKRKATGLIDTHSLVNAQELYNSRALKVKELQAWISSPARTQEIIEEKERNLNGNTILSTLPSFQRPELKEDKLGLIGESKGLSNIWKSLTFKKIDSSENFNDNAKLLNNPPANQDSSSLKKFNEKKRQLSKLLAELKKDEVKVKQSKKLLQDSVNKITQEINRITSSSSLYAFMENNGYSKDSLSKMQKFLLSINQVGIGRSFIDYSELTVKNISLTGVNIEANPGQFYIATAAGKVNYRFRDFILKNNYASSDQALYLLRAGIGKKDKNNLILTFYNGKKALLTPTPNNSSRSQKILGFSAESRLAIDANNYIIAEVAKSSFDNPRLRPHTDLFKNALDLKIHTNEAYSIKLFSQNPWPNTKISAYYKKMGENFQSFNLYPVNVNEASWMVRANQYFWNRKLTVDAGVRKNDFLSSIAVPSDFSTKTIFVSLQASLRIKKFPFISVGYYPTSQLSVLNNNTLVESQYNTLNAVISHSYLVRRISMNTTSVFTRFYNASTDTGFIYYNASSYTINHSIFLASFSLQSGVTIINEKALNLFTFEQSISYQIKNNFSLSAGLKWNRLNKTQNFYGGTAAMNVYIKKIGTIQVNYDKSFLPGYDRTLRAVDIGRVGFYKDF